MSFGPAAATGARRVYLVWAAKIAQTQDTVQRGGDGATTTPIAVHQVVETTI